MSILIRRLDGLTKGHVYLERDDLAEAMISTGQAERAAHDDMQRAVATQVETPGKSAALENMKLSDLKQEAEKRELKVKGTGSKGRVTKADLLKALR
tara:strand:+ start:1088 stop:1378 length:291 start_codon:yes stop_codon:yes gene_type:complete